MNVQEQQDLHYRARQAVRLAVKDGRQERHAHGDSDAGTEGPA
jgi:hypothetical protein